MRNQAKPINRLSRRIVTAARDRRGSMLTVLALLLPLFLIAAAFAVDVAYMHLTRIEMRRSTDAAARAAASALARHQDMDAARAAARDLAGINTVAGQPLHLDDADIVFGNSAPALNGSWSFSEGEQPTNSVRINSKRTRDSLFGSVGLFFGPLLGADDFEPTQSATAVRLDRDLLLVIDRSTSMKWAVDESTQSISLSDPRVDSPPNMSNSRWADLVAAVDEFNNVLDETAMTEQVGLVSYGGDSSYWPSGPGTYHATVDINQPLTLNHEFIGQSMNNISSLVFNGFTNISAGIDSGVAALTDSSTARPFAYKTMVLMTDGIWNRGEEPVLAAYGAADLDIVIHTVTFSDEANQTDMQAVAAATGGQHYHAPDAETLKAAFRDIARTLPVLLTE